MPSWGALRSSDEVRSSLTRRRLHFGTPLVSEGLVMTHRWADSKMPIVLSELVRTRELDGDLVVYHAGTDAVSHLDPIARTVWEHLVGRPTFPSLVASLAEHFSAEPERIATDVSVLLDDMLESQLISIAG